MKEDYLRGYLRDFAC